MSENLSFRSAINGFNKSDVLNYIEKLVNKNAQLSNDIEALKKEIETKSRLLEESSQNEAAAHPDENDIEKLSEQKLGKVMYDARRFSDQIIKEANERADFIFMNASNSSDALSQEVSALKNQTEEFSSSFISGLSEITEKLSSLGASLSAFSSGVVDEKKSFEENIAVEGEK